MYVFPSDEELVKIKDNYREVIESLVGKKIILYQGHIYADRDLSGIAKAMNFLGADYVLLLMGQDHGNFVNKYKDYRVQVLLNNYKRFNNLKLLPYQSVLLYLDK